MYVPVSFMCFVLSNEKSSPAGHCKTYKKLFRHHLAHTDRREKILHSNQLGPDLV